MARIRTIKPEFWDDGTLARVSRDCRAFFIGLWSFADDHGRGRAIPKRLAGDIFPHDADVDGGVISGWLDELADLERISLYEVSGERFYAVVNWDHQRIDHPGKPLYPDEGVPFRFGASASAQLSLINSRDSRETLAKTSRLEQGTGNREQGTGKARRDDDVRAVFEAWTATMPERSLTLTADRRRHINARLAEGCTRADLIVAVTAWVYDDWVDRFKHNDIDKLIGTRAKFEKWRDIGRAKGTTPVVGRRVDTPAPYVEPVSETGPPITEEERRALFAGWPK